MILAARSTQWPPVETRFLGRVDYEACFQEMRLFTERRTEETPDALWICEHAPVYTLGQAGLPEHLLEESTIPVRRVDRGGQITYHGPGQIVLYVLLDLSRRKLPIKTLVFQIEAAMIAVLNDYGILGVREAGAPGVYVDTNRGRAKIGALGLKVRRGRTYHGLSLNVDMDLAPFLKINPCGYSGLQVTQMRDLGVNASPETLAHTLAFHLLNLLEPAL